MLLKPTYQMLSCGAITNSLLRGLLGVFNAIYITKANAGDIYLIVLVHGHAAAASKEEIDFIQLGRLVIEIGIAL